MNKKCRIFIFVLSILYLLILVYILWINPFFHRSWVHKLEWHKYIVEATNLVPFRTIVNYIVSLKDGTINEGIVLSNLTANILMFMPFGFLLLFYVTHQSGKRIITYSICAIVISEVLQCIFKIGFLDIDDILLRILGAIIGYIFYRFLESVTRKIIKQNLNSNLQV